MREQQQTLVELAEQRALNRLQSHKNSFHTWRCVALACSLLAALTLLSKWNEVSTDLSMLLSIERLLSLPHSVNDTSGAISWPPVPLEQLLPALNDSAANAAFGMESLESNNSMLMSHMQMSLSRELTGNQLLRQEVESFAAEFRNAKSTLGLSTLLVSVYMISWILMMLATKETHNSNDISLRNILLLSVFGAIDLAASLGFVMVRLLMYAVKNNSFALQILRSSGLADTPTRLSADQLTAFTALRLIAMRSCSAHIDVYVSVLVALLTLLRLYAILRALTYFRRLRLFLDRRLEFAAEEQMAKFQHHQHQQQQQQHQQQKQQVWSTANLFEANSQPPPMISGTGLAHSPAQQQQQHHHISYEPHPQRSFRAASLIDHHQNSYQPALLATSYGQRSLLGVSATNRRSSSQRQQAQAQPPPPPQQLKQQQATTLVRGPRATPTPMVLLSPRPATTRRERRRAEEKTARAPAPGTSLVLVNGRAHHLVSDGSLSEPAGAAQPQVLVSDVAKKWPQQQQQQQEQQLSFHSLEDDLATSPSAAAAAAASNSPTEQVFQLTHESSEQNLLSAASNNEQRENFDTIRSNGTTYTLLSADQLERISRKLLGRAARSKSPLQPPAHQASSVTAIKTAQNTGVAAKLRLVSARQYRQMRASKSRQGGSAGLDSSTSCGADDSDNSLSVVSASARSQNRKMLATSLRQSEELQLADSLKQHMFEVPVVGANEESKTSHSGNLLKYYYYT